MHPSATFRLPDDAEVSVGVGAIIGRLATAALCVDDPRVSEAHAMVSLRGGALMLLALRGGLGVGRRKVNRVKLEVGLKVELVPGLALQVTELTLPTEVLAVRAGDEPAVPLVAGVYSVRAEGGVERLAPGYRDDASAHLWATAEGWRVRHGGGEPLALRHGVSWTAPGGTTFQAVAAPVRSAGAGATLVSGGPLRIVTRYETVHVHRDGAGGVASVRIPGLMARAITELAEYEAPVSWEMIARTLWKGEDDRFVLRQNWDRHLRLLRKRLRGANLREDLVRPDGCGNVELFLRPGDEVVQES